MQAGYFSMLDYVLMAAYALVLVGMGIWFKSKASSSLEDYIIGGRTIPWWIMGVSGMSNMLDLSGTALIISFLYLLGPRGFFIEFRGGACLILICMMLWTGKWHRRSGCLTAAEWNIFRYGDNWGGRFAEFISVVAAVIGTIGMLAYLIIGIGSFLSMFLPFSPVVCAAALVGIATLYIMVSGFYGVVYTDLFQSAIILVMVVYVSVIAFLKVPDAGTLSALAERITGNADWLSAYPGWETTMPAGYEMYRHLFMFMMFYLMRNLIGGMGTGADPKYFGARNDRDCGLLTCWWTFLLAFRWPMMMGTAVLGIFVVNDLFPDFSAISQAGALIHQYYPDIKGEGWGKLISSIAAEPQLHAADFISKLKLILGNEDFASRVHMVSFHGTVNPEKVLPAVLQFGVAKGMRGVIIIALVAAALTTLGSTINAVAGMMVRNVYQRYMRRSAATKELILALWISVVLLVSGAFIFALSLRSINDVWGWITMSLGSGLMAPSILRLYWARFNGGGFFWGTMAGMTGAIVQRLCWKDMTEDRIFLLTLAIGIIGSVLGTFLTKQTEEGVLKKFYMKTRPFGIWGRFKKQLTPVEYAKVDHEHRCDLLALPFMLIWQVTMFLTPMLVIVHNWQAAGVCALLWLIGSVGLWYFWYRNLPAENWYEK